MPKISFRSNFWETFIKARQLRPRQASIYRSLPLGMTVVVFAMVFIGGFSAIVLIWRQL